MLPFASRDRFRQMLEDMPVNVMTCDLKDFRIDYANRATIETLRKIEHALPIKADRLVGSSIDIFHKNPGHQRRMLADPRNLPHRARITIGGEILDLVVSAIRIGGKYVGPMVTWQLVTEQTKIEQHTERLLQMVDNMPINVMTCDPVEFKIDYVNKTSRQTLAGLQQYLRVGVDNLVGTSIDIFHKNPGHQRNILSNPRNLPHSAKIKLGPETLDLRVSAMLDKAGGYVGPMLTWSVATNQIKLADDFETSVKGIVGTVSAAAGSLRGTAQALAGATTEMNAQSGAVASATEELSVSIAEISRQVNQSSAITGNAVQEAETASELVGRLSEAADRIGSVVRLISEIAGKTNLLALNATIEAARAGAAGKGFAVVAEEVKSLANQTGKATSEITGQVSEMQAATETTVEAIKRIRTVITEMNQISAAVAAAVEQQDAATKEVARNIESVSAASAQTGRNASLVLESADLLATDADRLAHSVDGFLVAVRKL